MNLRLTFLVFLTVPTIAMATTAQLIQSFTLHDQHEQPRRYAFPKRKISVITVADYNGSQQLEPWISYLYNRFGTRIDIDGVADVSGVPSLFRDALRISLRGQMKRSIMLDWTGKVVNQFGSQPKVANIYVVDRDGSVRSHFTGAANETTLRSLTDIIERLVAARL